MSTQKKQSQRSSSKNSKRRDTEPLLSATAQWAALAGAAILVVVAIFIFGVGRGSGNGNRQPGLQHGMPEIGLLDDSLREM